MMMNKGIYGITQDHVDCPLTQKWASMLPKDRKEIVDEMAIRKKNHLGTTTHLLEMAGDTADPEQEAEDVLTEWKEEAKILALERPVPGAGGGAGGKTNDSQPKSKTDNKLK